MGGQAQSAVADGDFIAERSRRLRRWRYFKDVLAARLIAVGGIAVVAAVVLICFYLLWVVLPLFGSASIAPAEAYRAPHLAETHLLALEEQGQLGAALAEDASLLYFEVGSGDIRQTVALPAAGRRVADVATRAGSQRALVGFDDGNALPVTLAFDVRFDDAQKVVVPRTEYPAGETPLALVPAGRSLREVAFASDDEGGTLAGIDGEGSIHLTRYRSRQNFLTGETETDVERGGVTGLNVDPTDLVIDANQRWLFVAAADGTLSLVDIRRLDNVNVVDRAPISTSPITALETLLGGISVLAGSEDGTVAQVFAVRDEQNRYSLQKVRSFDVLDGAIAHLISEHRRKGFVAIDADGDAAIFHSTAARTVLAQKLSRLPIDAAAIGPRSDRLLVRSAGGDFQAWALDNEHPEISWRALWGSVWYENYDGPRLIWQSSAANNDFEPKFSLTPLAFGTLKAAFYAMLFAVPLALAGAIYTAYFMAPGMRRFVKPTVEIMEALPTVILGFLAGLWFAPYVEANLAGVFCVLLLLPVSLLAVAFGWRYLPNSVRRWVPDGWTPALLVPVVAILTIVLLGLGDVLESVFFAGNLPRWFDLELGIGYDQRNAMVVGIAMGFAVIPTIFSLAEDAIFSVPKSLAQGSLALGATSWQTVTRVVLPTASPGIFSALMIGMGRAVGETMIVLMATGNTPVMDLSIFEGMRTLSANIAVEMPESEVNSTHYRVLFLAALVLFMFTFVVNTVAEIVRQRLRERYSSL